MDIMLGVALSDVRGLLNDLLEKLSGKDWAIWLPEFKKFLRKEPCWVEKIVDLLLEPFGIVTIPSTTAPFVAKDKFIRDTSDEAGVKISCLGDNFKSWFLDGDGKIEDPESEQSLRYHKLCKASVDSPIIEELGGEENSETTLTEIFALMKMQSKGEEGVLLNNGYNNIFYIRDLTGVLRAVCVGWRGGGWDVDAYSVGNPVAWRGGCQVFSRNN